MHEVTPLQPKEETSKSEYLELTTIAEQRIQESEGIRGLSVIILFHDGTSTHISRAEDSTSLLGHLTRAASRLAHFLNRENENE